MTVLALDASTARATVALIRSGASREVVAAVEVAERSEHVEPLLPAVLALLASASVPLTDVSAIVCGAGPGSFTGLRTAASIAKGLAMGLSIPLYAIPSLPLILSGLPAGRYVATLDAGRGDSFAALMSWPSAEAAGYVVAPTTTLGEFGALIVGPHTGHWPHARGAATLPWGNPVDLASWEPDYGRNSAAEDKRRASAPGAAR